MWKLIRHRKLGGCCGTGNCGKWCSRSLHSPTTRCTQCTLQLRCRSKRQALTLRWCRRGTSRSPPRVCRQRCHVHSWHRRHQYLLRRTTRRGGPLLVRTLGGGTLLVGTRSGGTLLIGARVGGNLGGTKTAFPCVRVLMAAACVLVHPAAAIESIMQDTTEPRAAVKQQPVPTLLSLGHRLLEAQETATMSDVGESRELERFHLCCMNNVLHLLEKRLVLHVTHHTHESCHTTAVSRYVQQRCPAMSTSGAPLCLWLNSV